jgi:hypothetical protein
MILVQCTQTKSEQDDAGQDDSGRKTTQHVSNGNPVTACSNFKIRSSWEIDPVSSDRCRTDNKTSKKRKPPEMTRRLSLRN